jgi:hypothetical protein
MIVLGDLNVTQQWCPGLMPSELLCGVAGLLIPDFLKVCTAFMYKGSRSQSILEHPLSLVHESGTVSRSH